MKKLHDAVDSFCARHPRFGISNLMRVVVIGNILVYFLMLLSDYSAIRFLTFNLEGLLHGEIWRILTYVFVPAYSGAFSLIISLYFYYWIGSTLENRWGTERFNLYYIGGVLLTAVGVTIASLITGQYGLSIAGAEYVNLSMFLAFAAMFPDAQVLLFFLIPIKIKWLAWLDGGLFAVNIITALMHGNIVGVIVPLLALLNFAIFIWPEVHYRTERFRYQRRPQTIQFKKAVAQQQKDKGYHHKCCVCGRTDTDYPNLQFRYCSKCAGYHCFCEDHIFNHVHFTEDDE